jgi:hypothetical protein
MLCLSPPRPRCRCFESVFLRVSTCLYVFPCVSMVVAVSSLCFSEFLRVSTCFYVFLRVPMCFYAFLSCVSTWFCVFSSVKKFKCVAANTSL